MVGVTEDTGTTIGDTLATGEADGDIQDGDTRDGVTLVIGDLVTDMDTTTTLITMEEEVLPLIMEEETILLEAMPQTEATTPTELTTLTETTPVLTAAITAIEPTAQTEVISLIQEEMRLQTEEPTTTPHQTLQTEETQLNTIVLITATEDHQVTTTLTEVTTTTITILHQQEATLLAHPVL